MVRLNNLQQWLLYTPLGRHILVNERIFYHNIVQNIFGYYSIQIGMSNINFLQGNKISRHYILGHDIECDLAFLPFANNSIDLIVCPHILEFMPNYGHLLNECQRVLMPEGKLIITNFNYSSLLRLYKPKHVAFNEINFISLDTLKQQLYALGLRIDGGKFFSYRLPMDSAKTLSRLKWMDKVGDRWLPTFANNYALIASKEIAAPTMVGRVANAYDELEPSLEPSSVCQKK